MKRSKLNLKFMRGVDYKYYSEVNFDVFNNIDLNCEIRINTKINTMGNLKIFERLEFIGGGDRNRTDE